MVEKVEVSQNEIIARSLQLTHAKERRAQDIEQAKILLPSLQNKIHAFIDAKLPEDSHLKIPRKLTQKEMDRQAKRRNDIYLGKTKPKPAPIRTVEQIEREKLNAVKVTAKIPVGEEAVLVTIERGLDIDIYESGNSLDLTIRVQNLPYFYTLNRGIAAITSVAQKPLPRGGPYGGPAYRRIPEWTREWRTTDVENVSGLIDALRESNSIVEAKEIRVFDSSSGC